MESPSEFTSTGAAVVEDCNFWIVASNSLIEDFNSTSICLLSEKPITVRLGIGDVVVDFSNSTWIGLLFENPNTVRLGKVNLFGVLLSDWTGSDAESWTALDFALKSDNELTRLGRLKIEKQKEMFCTEYQSYSV